MVTNVLHIDSELRGVIEREEGWGADVCVRKRAKRGFDIRRLEIEVSEGAGSLWEKEDRVEPCHRC